ncbi:hypothetical protein D9V30_13150 [Mycetocola reblochoni]|uniref:Uncharacterized protein n=2 Tax=Mycetocola reblochoni TaxID=331618 RepID=A0A1R4K2W7_9MICO|nr:hypothetical protein D9V30_13150 [Mycetocola reblochoni]SJN38532.1 hypothetical protein FM119_10980 [Mycetocola reblochoni REB411]
MPRHPEPDRLPVHGTGRRPLEEWYRQHPEVFRRGRAPLRTIGFTLLTVVGALLTVRVLSDPDQVAHLLSGSGADRRTGIALVSALVLPPLATLLGIVGLLRWSSRWLLTANGSAMTVGTTRRLGAERDTAEVLALVTGHAGDPDGFAAALEPVRHDPDGARTLVAESSADASALVALVWRHADDGRGWVIEQQPVMLTGDDAFPVLTALRDHENAKAEAAKAQRQRTDDGDDAAL